MPTTNKKVESFSDEEREAMKERIQELRSAKDGEELVLEKINSMPEPDRSLAKKFHEIVKKNAPELTPRTWYGMPAYAKADKVICWFQDANKFKARYANIGFSDKANLDEGEMWPIAYAVKKLTPTEETKISSLVKKAVG